MKSYLLPDVRFSGFKIVNVSQPTRIFVRKGELISKPYDIVAG